MSDSDDRDSDGPERGPGRPRVEVDTEAVRKDLEAGMSTQATARKHRIGRRTLRRILGL